MIEKSFEKLSDLEESKNSEKLEDINTTQTEVDQKMAQSPSKGGSRFWPGNKSVDTTKREEKRTRRTNKKITRKHPEFELTYDMMLGIRTTVSRREASGKPSELSLLNFKRRNKMRFPKKGSSYTPAHTMNSFRFKDYAPDVFKWVRQRFEIEPTDYLISLCSDFPYLEFVSNSKSGQFFFYSHDRRFMIKTQNKRECHFLIKLLPHYCKHVENYDKTLLTQFLGMHRVKRKNHRPVYFVIMANVFFSEKYINEVYDLKGSTLGRFATSEEKNQEVPILKDNDFVEDGVRLNLGPNLKITFLGQINADCEFLTRMKIMDYSLILGIHYSENSELDYINMGGKKEIPIGKQLLPKKQSIFAIKKNREVTSPYQKQFRAQSIEIPPRASFTKRSTMKDCPDKLSQVRSLDRTKTYFLGVIDILQQYNMRKRIEHNFKSMKYDDSSISAVNPKKYAKRLITFLEKYVD